MLEPDWSLAPTNGSKWNVVVGGAPAEVCVRRSGCACGDELVAAGLAGVAAAAEELHAVRDDLDRLALGPVLRFPFAPLEPSVDRDRPALGEVLRTALALVAPDRDVEVVRLLGPLAGRAVLAPRVDGDAEAADCRAARRVPQLGVPRQVPDEHDAVDVGHGLAPLLRGVPRLLRGPVGVIGRGGHGRNGCRRRALRAAADAAH